MSERTLRPAEIDQLEASNQDFAVVRALIRTVRAAWAERDKQERDGVELAARLVSSRAEVVALEGEVRAWKERANEADRDLAAAVDEIDRWKKYGDVWKARYQELVMDPLPRLLYRRLVVQVARLLGGKR